MSDEEIKDVPGNPEANDEVAGNEDSKKLAESFLRDINKATGRNYQTIDDAKRGIEETYKFVGQRDKIQETPKEEPKSQKPTSDFEERLNRMEFASQNPEYKDYYDLVSGIAKSKNISTYEALNNTLEGQKIKKLVDMDKGSVAVESSNRLKGGNKVDLAKFKTLSKEDKAKALKAMGLPVK